MSWGISSVPFDPAEPDEFDKKLKEHMNAYTGDHVPFMVEQTELASTIVKQLADSGVVGTAKKFMVNVSGHANVDHEPTPGWANDCMTIQISQVG